MARETKLKIPHAYLVKLDRRSGTTFDHFSHRVDISSWEEAKDFILWAKENLGTFLPWNLYYCRQDKPDLIVPHWTVRYLEAGEPKLSVFLRPDVVPYVMLMWLP